MNEWDRNESEGCDRLDLGGESEAESASLRTAISSVFSAAASSGQISRKRPARVLALIDPRANWIALEASTRCRISAEVAPVSLPRNSLQATAGTSMCKSMRSSNGPLILPCGFG